MNLYLIRGAPGSGKSTLAEQIVGSFCVIEADQYFVKDGAYQYDASKIKDAHEWCQYKTMDKLKLGFHVAVANTFTRLWELAPYYDMKGVLPDLNIIEIPVWVNKTAEQLANRCIHKVPVDKIQMMLNNFESRKY